MINDRGEELILFTLFALPGIVCMATVGEDGDGGIRDACFFCLLQKMAFDLVDGDLSLSFLFILPQVNNYANFIGSDFHFGAAGNGDGAGEEIFILCFSAY